MGATADENGVIVSIFCSSELKIHKYTPPPRLPKIWTNFGPVMNDYAHI